MIVSALIALVAAALVLALIMAGAWLAQQRTGRSGWVDTIWTFAVGLVGAALALAPVGTWPSLPGRRILVAVLALAWSIRLGLHIMERTRKGGDDPRYRALADEWGAAAPRRMFWFLQLQAACAFLLVLSIFAAAQNPIPFPDIGDILGAAIFIVAIVGETVADRQLRRFAADPRSKGRVCDVGLWSVSRHPNYFFEWLGWIAYPLIAIGLPPGNALGMIAFVGPIFMYWLLVYVSGVPPLEAHMERSRGEAFRAYQRRVNVFFPGPSRRDATERRSQPS
jgi:steroid 5-alpha reductase family enzyme